MLFYILNCIYFHQICEEKQCINPTFITFWLPYPVCGTQSQGYWFLQEIDTSKAVPINIFIQTMGEMNNHLTARFFLATQFFSFLSAHCFCFTDHIVTIFDSVSSHQHSFQTQQAVTHCHSSPSTKQQTDNVSI